MSPFKSPPMFPSRPTFLDLRNVSNLTYDIKFLDPYSSRSN